MIRYSISRFVFIWLVMFFTGWALNIGPQVLLFFDIDLSSGFFLKILKWLFTILILFYGLFIINIVYTSISLLNKETDYKDKLKIILSESKPVNYVKAYIYRIFKVLSLNFDNEVKKERFSSMYVVFIFFYIPLTMAFVKGNPLIYNYIGIYKEYESVEAGRYGESSYTPVKSTYIVNKRENKVLALIVNEFKKDYDNYYEPDFEIKKRNYIFIQAGLMDGFESIDNYYKGFAQYFICVLYSLCEKFISCFLYFMIPYLLAMYLYIRNDKKMHTPLG